MNTDEIAETKTSTQLVIMSGICFVLSLEIGGKTSTQLVFFVKKLAPQINTDEHRWNLPYLCSSVFICGLDFAPNEDRPHHHPPDCWRGSGEHALKLRGTARSWARSDAHDRPAAWARRIAYGACDEVWLSRRSHRR